MSISVGNVEIPVDPVEKEQQNDGEDEQLDPPAAEGQNKPPAADEQILPQAEVKQIELQLVKSKNKSLGQVKSQVKVEGQIAPRVNTGNESKAGPSKQEIEVTSQNIGGARFSSNDTSESSSQDCTEETSTNNEERPSSSEIAETNSTDDDIDDENIPLVSSDLKDVELWISVQEIIYRNMSETSFFSSLVSIIGVWIAALIFELQKKKFEYKYYVVLGGSIMMFFCTVYFLASFIDFISSYKQSIVFANEEQGSIWNTFCRFYKRTAVIPWKYVKGIGLSFMPTLKFVCRTFCKFVCRTFCRWGCYEYIFSGENSDRPSNPTPVEFSDTVCLWLVIQAKTAKKNSLINLGVAFISLLISIICCGLAFICVFSDEKLMAVTAFAFYFLGSSLYTLTESFSCFVQAAILADVDLEGDFRSRLRRFFKFIECNIKCGRTSVNIPSYQSVPDASPVHAIAH